MTIMKTRALSSRADKRQRYPSGVIWSVSPWSVNSPQRWHIVSETSKAVYLTDDPDGACQNRVRLSHDLIDFDGGNFFSEETRALERANGCLESIAGAGRQAAAELEKQIERGHAAAQTIEGIKGRLKHIARYKAATAS